MDIHDCIMTRRSMRKYKEEKIGLEKLAKVLDAVRWAPSWANTQIWEVVVVDDPELKKDLQECVPDGNPGRKAVIQAPVVLAVCGRSGKSGYYNDKPSTIHGDWAMFDLGIACQNICLAAWAEGLGTLHLGLLDHEKAGRALGLPQDVKLFELIPLGIPDKEGKAPSRRAVVEFTHKNRFGDRFGV
jgi:nitroreductase